MKVYVVYESFYGELNWELATSTNLVGVYYDIEKAKEKVMYIVDEDLKNDYVLDKEIENVIKENGGYYRLFYNEQENWNCYYEIYVEVREVE